MNVEHLEEEVVIWFVLLHFPPLHLVSLEIAPVVVEELDKVLNHQSSINRTDNNSNRIQTLEV
jgi:hypothetical protein